MNEFIMEVDIIGAEESYKISSESWESGRLSSKNSRLRDLLVNVQGE